MTSTLKGRHRKAARPLTPLSDAPRMARRGLAVAASSGLALTMIASGASATNQNAENASASAGTLKAGITAEVAKAATQNAAITVPKDAAGDGALTAVAAVAKTEDTARIEAEEKAAEERAAAEQAAAEQAATTAAGTTEQTATTAAGTTATVAASASTATASSSGIAATAMQYVGSAYAWAAAGPAAFDCSGLVSYVYAQHGISLPHSSSAILASGTVVSASAAQPGDVLYWPGHVAIYVGDGMMVSADNPSAGVTYRSIDSGATFVRVG